VREYDLLHVIPQGEAFEHRDQLFYDPEDYAPILQKVFRLGKNPRFHVWTNRFPVMYLEGMEELIQDPHKMLDEVGGRRMQFRRYLDSGEPIECRHSERCPHCFIEPFCTALDASIQQLHSLDIDVWWVGEKEALSPVPGALLGVTGQGPFQNPVYLVAKETLPESLPSGSCLVVSSAVLLDQLSSYPESEVELQLNQDTCQWLLNNPEKLAQHLLSWRLHAPRYPSMEESHAKSPDYRAFFTTLLPLLPAAPSVSGLPACLCPGARLVPEKKIFDSGLFHQDGRMAIDKYVSWYIQNGYYAKSLRCKSCSLVSRCKGAQLQYLRHAGFAVLQPVHAAPSLLESLPPLPPRLASGSPPLPPPPRFASPDAAPVPEIDVLPGRRS
jgi:hypothetical protein